ncbi:unnamed protein product [Lupinus luteus]|uniref:Uncharacterized protein n=1 Tax=Lupinus luteus TaxID=3873 RepID=A0AAV1Y474_LUPLU
MAGRGHGRGHNDLLAQMAVVLQKLNQNVNQNPNQHPIPPRGPVEYRGLDVFCKHYTSQFQGRFAHDDAVEHEILSGLGFCFYSVQALYLKRIFTSALNVFTLVLFKFLNSVLFFVRNLGFVEINSNVRFKWFQE